MLFFVTKTWNGGKELYMLFGPERYTDMYSIAPVCPSYFMMPNFHHALRTFSRLFGLARLISRSRKVFL
jgi:hypothetical protein